MKKMILVALIAISSVLTASAVPWPWQITALNQVGGSTARIVSGDTSYKIYLIYSVNNVANYSVDTGTGAITLSDINGTDTVVDSFVATANGGTGITPRNVEFGYPLNTVASYYFLAAYDSGGVANIAGGVDQYYVSNILTGTTYVDGANTPDYNALLWSIASTATWTAVPEPTSMALLAFGAAALGLRRKFRK